MTDPRIRAAVTESIRAVLPDVAPEDIRPECSLAELGATSIDRVDITLGAMEALELVIPATAFAGISTIGGLIEVLDAWARRG